MPGSSPTDSLRTWCRVAARPLLMGIVNCTPDSFSDGGVLADVDDALRHAQNLAAAGAEWLDVGGESTRPGAAPVTPNQEWQRVEPVLAALAGLLPHQLVSIDTRHASVAERALAAGVRMVNDVSAGNDPEMFPLVAAHKVPMCLMHMQGSPATMQDQPTYVDVVDEVEQFFEQRIAAATAAGIDHEYLVLDPGIGFGKTLAHNRSLLEALPRLSKSFDCPLLVGLSRKSLISMWLERDVPVDQRDHLSHVLHAQIAPHCDILRVHDVAGARDACTLVLAGASA